MYADGRRDYLFLVISSLRYSQMYPQPRTPEMEIQFINIVVILLNCTCGFIKSLSEILPFPITPCAQTELTVFAMERAQRELGGIIYVPQFHFVFVIKDKLFLWSLFSQFLVSLGKLCHLRSRH